MDENEEKQTAAEIALLENVKCEIEDLENVVKDLEHSLAITKGLLKGMKTERDYLEEKLHGKDGVK